MASPNGSRTRRPLLVELVGPAGAGKSTLMAELRALHPGAVMGLKLWGLPRRLLFGSAIALVPPIISVARSGGRLQADRIGKLIRLRALRRVLDEAGPDHRLIVMEEGPVFALACLDVSVGADDDHFWAGWRRRAVAEWAAQLDVVVRLDAPDHVLAQRIRARAQPHPVKNSPDAEIFEFSERFRRVLDRVITSLKEVGDLRVVRMRSDAGPPRAMALRLRTALSEADHGR